MRYAAAALLAVFLVTSMLGCQSSESAYDILTELVTMYPAEGVIYSSELAEDEDGYATEELFRSIFISYGIPPEQYAVFLNSHVDFGAECGVFISDSADEQARIVEMCRERMSLLDPKGEHAILLKKGSVIFYSTMPDQERAEELFRQVLR